jgi:hypothetical protein
MSKVHKFSDFSSRKHLDGEKIKINDILDKEILVKDFFIGKSKHNSGDFIKLQFIMDDKLCVTNSGSNVLIDQISGEDVKFPFLVKIVKIDRYFKFI